MNTNKTAKLNPFPSKYPNQRIPSEPFRRAKDNRKFNLNEVIKEENALTNRLKLAMLRECID